jgi:hypothetical protein
MISAHKMWVKTKILKCLQLKPILNSIILEQLLSKL